MKCRVKRFLACVFCYGGYAKAYKPMSLKPKARKRLFSRFSGIFACFSAKSTGRKEYKHVEDELFDEYFVGTDPMVSVAGNAFVFACYRFN